MGPSSGGTASVDMVTLFLCGDVMLGRGVDQILPHPGDPMLRESHIEDARSYVELAEEVGGAVPRPAGFDWPWGEVLEALEAAAPDVRVINLETSITRGGSFAPGKLVHYRMNPANIPALAAGRPDVCVLANNHVLDFGPEGLLETLGTLEEAGLTMAGAGRDARAAHRPAAVPTGAGGRVLVFSCGTASSGIPAGWAAAPDRPGVAFVPEVSEAGATEITGRVRGEKRAGDVAVASIHWGSNWGYAVPPEQVRFARALVDGGVDIVHGHSSHHPRPVELYRGRLILYGCGDFIDDYEGITGHEEYRSDLRLPYLATVDPRTGALAGLRTAPLQARRMRLQAASGADAEWLTGLLNEISRDFGARFTLEPDGGIALRPG